MPKIYSYVVEHDYGFAPNPFGDFCSLAKCKFGLLKRNIVDLAEKGDWIVGTGGSDLRKSAGHGKLIYAMRIDEKIPLSQYCQTHCGDRIDAEHDIDEVGRFSLISNHFFYFGRNAINISEFPTKYLDHSFEKSGPGYRADFSAEFIEEFARWLKDTFKVGVHGRPCKPLSDLQMPKCLTVVRRI